MLLFGLGAIIMRGAGCVVNDILDRDVDRQVERTRSRPLASGEIRLWQALAFLAVLLAMGLGLLLLFNPLTVGLGVASLALVAVYPLAKRHTWWPQLVLGLAFNWGALMGWSAATGGLGWPALLLYAGGVFWTLGYDTIYAHQDRRDDALIGVKSLALRLGGQSPFWITCFYMSALFLLAMAGYAAGLRNGFYIALLPAVLHARWQVEGWKMDEPDDCLRRFRSNRDFGLLVLAAFWIGKIL
jgi:4-hydroxybenzoate polyprenyltransferase